MKKIELEQALRRAENDAGNLHCFVNDLVNDKVTWFRRGQWRLGISREAGACGGLVAVQQKAAGSKYCTVHLWEPYIAELEGSIPAHTDSEAMDLRNLAFEVKAHVQKVQSLVAMLPPEFKQAVNA